MTLKPPPNSLSSPGMETNRTVNWGSWAAWMEQEQALGR